MSATAKLILITLGVSGWTVFGYAVLISAFFSTTGLLQVCLGIYLLGGLVIGGWAVLTTHRNRR